jgi:glucosyl-3-phosphoglycerate phosphatase
MELFLVRHGQTAGNLAGRHQADETDLTLQGEQQATAAAHIIHAIQPTHLITSTMLRAVETARIISQVCDLIPETNALFRELEKPPRLNGHLLKSLYSLWFYARWYLGLTNHTKEGGEAYAEFRQRLKNARLYLEAYPPEARVVVVSHSVFITFFIMHRCHEGPLFPWTLIWCFIKVLTIKNGSVVKLVYDPHTVDRCAWRVDVAT